MQTQERKYDSCSGCFIHLFWLLLGNLALLIVAGRLLFHTGGMFSLLDAVYWLLVVLILLARYADIRYFKGAAADGKPCSLEDWRRYALIFVLWAGLVWMAVHLLGLIGPSIQRGAAG